MPIARTEKMVKMLSQCEFGKCTRELWPMSLLRWKKDIGEDTFIVCEVSFHAAPLMFVVWLQYAAFEEIDTKDYDRARDVYKAAVKLVPHKTFTFAKVSCVCSGQTKEYL